MRILLDLQAAQGSNRHRGIGGYSLSFAKAIVCNRGEHEVHLGLNGLFPETIEPLRAYFDGHLPQENIHIWEMPGPVSQIDADNDDRRCVAELVREAFLANLKPDIVHIASLFEGLADDVVTSIGEFTTSIATSVTLFDLIPYLHRIPYLENPLIEQWYERKLDSLRRADLVLSISDSSRQEGIDVLGLTAKEIVNVSSAVGENFCSRPITPLIELELRERYGLYQSFVMYTGGIDHRKNIERLIRSYAKLPCALREGLQLAIICSIQSDTRTQLEALAKRKGLKEHEVKLTGFIPEDDLISLYNLCKIFIFPSIHEGFGLPALEAMQCGAAVIASNTSSLPEVIGRDDALFDPYSEESITAKLQHALTDDEFRHELSRHGLEQAKKFSWDQSAIRAITAFEVLHASRSGSSKASAPSIRRPTLAFVSPLPPERSGIADYSVGLLPELSRYYKIEVVVLQGIISDPWVLANCVPRSPNWLRENRHALDRVLYHFGNSDFHTHMFELLSDVPGTVVLHDFFLSGIQAHREASGACPRGWTRELYHSHGYAAVRARYHAQDSAEVVWKYPANLSVLQQAQGLIVHSKAAKKLAGQWYGEEYVRDFAVIPLLRCSSERIDRTLAREMLKLPKDSFIVCSFGMIGPTKLNHRLIDAWLSSSLAQDERCQLIFVGENDPGKYGDQLLATIKSSDHRERIRIVGWTDVALFRQYLTVADIGVQLRTLSRGETSAAILDCMSYGVPAIVNANGSMADLADDAVWKLPDAFEDALLIEALEELKENTEIRDKLKANAEREIRTNNDPRECARKYFEAVEGFHHQSQAQTDGLIKAIARVQDFSPTDLELAKLSRAIAKTIPIKAPLRQLLVDISELVQRDAKTGIQRVTRSILGFLLAEPPEGYRVEPVYATADCIGYRYARKFTSRFLNCPPDWAIDDVVEVCAGDIFLGLDLQPQIVPIQRPVLQGFHNCGVRIYFVIYDLLPICLREFFVKDAHIGHEGWLNVVAQFDGAIAISKSVADELMEWFEMGGAPRSRSFNIGWFHLGADVENSMGSHGLPANYNTVLERLKENSSFLMVGTLEPRKAHVQVLAAFEQLWKAGVAVTLVIVGKQGWLTDELENQLRNHPEKDKRLFWLEGISDEYLEKVYAASTCLLLASKGEGFGLPLIEAAQHGMPILARDLPVFREVAGEHAFYFSGNEPSALASALTIWLALYEAGQHPSSKGLPWLTWQQSAEQLKRVVFQENWYLTWNSQLKASSTN